MSKIAHLKVKIKSLAAEARIIRHEEYKAKRHRAWCKANKEDEYQEATDAFWSLRHHRTWQVASAARSALLAYGFLRGVSYESMEQKTSSPPNFDYVKKQVERFGGCSEDLWLLWVGAAQGHIKATKLAA